MKIAIITSCSIRLFPEIDHTPFSISAITYNLAEELTKRGHDITLFATSDSITSAKLAKNLFKSTDPILKNFSYENPNHNKIHHAHLEKAVEESEKFDILYSSSTDFIPYSKLTKTPAIVTMHGPSISKTRLFFKNENIIAISKNQIKNNPDINFVGIVYNGINIQDFTFNNFSDNYLVWLGRITPIKGAMEAIQAAKKAKKKLILAGNIDQNEKDYAQKIFKEIENNKLIEYIGEVDLNKKNNILKNAAATLMPIQWEEPFGLVSVESMACGTPVIVFDRGALPEIIKNNKTGFIVNNEDEMVKAIKKISTIDRYKCRERVEENFTVEKMTDGYEEIFTKIIKKNKR